jgi:hypothetical protein
MSEGGKGHPLPGSGEARHGEIPEGIEADKGRGQDPEEIVSPDPDGMNPDGGPYRYDVAQESRAPHGSALSGGQGDLNNGRGPGTEREPEPGP